ncbi:MAG: Rho termination factor N-terminal domain-containing protein, partial [Chloroflexi bacterium]|nr:Rho termination factor N-terminal domain-containing protein [Chloroflexota bacterium]
MNLAELENKTRDELLDIAKQLDIPAFSGLRKHELI